MTPTPPKGWPQGCAYNPKRDARRALEPISGRQWRKARKASNRAKKAAQAAEKAQ